MTTIYRVHYGDGASNDYPEDVYREMAAGGIIDGLTVEIVPTPPTADDVRAEASRRIQALVGARSAEHLQIVVANASREAIRLLRIKTERAQTVDEAARAAALEAEDAAIEAIRAASNAMEVDPPMDYASDERWP